MFTLKIENEYHSQVKLTQNENKWQITRVTGLNPPAAVISTAAVAGFDGERFNSSRMGKRNIVIDFVINGSVDRNLTELNSVIFPKRYIKVYYASRSKDLYIEGYVEAFEYDHFNNKCACQLSVICLSPFWISNELTEANLSPVVDLFEFPFSIPVEGIALSEFVGSRTGIVPNRGNIETGAIIEIEAVHNIVEPYIVNITTGEKMTIRRELKTGDRIIISTIKGDKYIKSDCNCVESNIINYLTSDSSWIKLVPGNNQFNYAAVYGTDNMRVTVKHRDLYGGV